MCSAGSDDTNRSGRGNADASRLSEDVWRSAGDSVLPLEHGQEVVVGNLPERYDNLDPIQKLQLAFQIASASADLFSCRLVIRRSTVTGRGDVCIIQRKPVVDGTAGGLSREASRVENPIQEVATAIAVNMRPYDWRRVLQERGPGSAVERSGRRRTGQAFPNTFDPCTLAAW